MYFYNSLKVPTLSASEEFAPEGRSKEMTKIQWLSSFDTGISSIDKDHHDLIEAISGVQAALDGDDLESATGLFENFLNMARSHFAREEAFLKKIYFPRIEAHSVAHRELLVMGESIVAQTKNNMDGPQAKKHLEDMVYFLLEDIIKADADFKSYAQEHGAQ